MQSSGCAPVAKAFDEGARSARCGRTPLHLPSGFAFPSLTAIPSCWKFCASPAARRVAIPDEEILASLRDWAKERRTVSSPEGAAATAAYDHLIATGFPDAARPCGTVQYRRGLKYTDVIAEAMNLRACAGRVTARNRCVSAEFSARAARLQI